VVEGLWEGLGGGGVGGGGLEGEDCGVGGVDVGGGDDVVEAVSRVGWLGWIWWFGWVWLEAGLLLKDRAAFLIVGSCHEDCLIPQAARALEEFAEGSVRLDKVVRRERHSQSLAEVLDTLRFVLPSAVGEQDEGDVVVVEEPKDLGGAGNRLGDVKENAVDAAWVLFDPSIS
jgi:hypothetical protein